jgi:hypothetical protein
MAQKEKRVVKYMSRKFLLVLVAITILAVAFFTTKKMTADNFVWGLCGLVATYITGNAVVKFSKQNDD